MQKIIIAVLFSCLFLCSKQEQEQIDGNLYGTWLFIGKKDVTAYGTSEKGYSIQEAFSAYRIEEGVFKKYYRGYDDIFAGVITYNDSIDSSIIPVTIHEGSITVDGGTVSYSIRTACNLVLLKLSSEETGYNPDVGSLTVQMNEYYVKVKNDSLPEKWPTEEDVFVGVDSLCPDIGNIITW